MKVRCVVACTNANGEPDLYFVKVHCSLEDFDDGEHYEGAKESALREDHEGPFVVFDEFSSAGRAMMPLFGGMGQVVLMSMETLCMTKPQAYDPQDGYMFQLFARNLSYGKTWEHCDYAKDRTERNYLQAEYAMAYGAGWEFKSIRLPRKYWQGEKS